MTSQIAAITFDCANAYTVAQFWSAALGRPVEDGDPEARESFARIAGSEGDGAAPTMMFVQVPEPKTVKNRAHLDLTTTDRAAEVERLLALGASQVHDKGGTQWTTLADPEGNEFCVMSG